MIDTATLKPLRAGTGWIELVALTEPDVLLTFRGYAPVLHVRQTLNSLEYFLYISAKSIAEPLERLRRDNGGRFSGIAFSIRKSSTDRMASYEIRHATDSAQDA